MKKPVFYQAIGLGLVIATLGSVVTAVMAETEPIWYNCLTREVFSPEKQIWCDRWRALQNGTYTVPTSLVPNPEYRTLTLSNGRYQQEDEPSGNGTFIVELVNQAGWIAFGDLNNDGKEDAAVIFGVGLDPDGRAIATYLTAVLDIDDAAQALTPVRLGERIMLNGPIGISNHRITVPLLTSTEVNDRTYVVDGTNLSELAQLPSPDREPANLPDGTLIFWQSSSYALRLFSQNGQPRLNLYNKETARPDLTAVPVSIAPVAADTVYRYEGEPAVQVEVSNAGPPTVGINGRKLQDYEQVTGTVTYRLRMALPANAIVEVALVDVSRADAAAVTLSSQAIVVGDRQVPIPFALAYDPEQIDPRFSYAIQARIIVDGQLRFINTTRTSVITQDHPNQVDVIVSPVSGSSD